MAEQITITTVYGTTEALHWYLSDEEMMWAALKELIREHQHRGVIMEWPDANRDERWQLEVNDSTGNTTTAGFAEHLVLVEGGRLMAYTQQYYETVKTEQGE